MGSGLSPQIASALQSGTIALTASQRAARSLRRAFDAAEMEVGHTLWHPPDVLALDTWLADLWRTLLLEGHATRMLLNRTQEQTLWREIIAADPEAASLQSAASLADLAARAWRLLHLHGGSARHADFAQSTDTRAFARWAVDFERRCRQERLLTAAELPAVLARTLAEGLLTVPAAGLLLVDFDELLPAYERLFASIADAGYDVRRIATGKPPASAELFAAPCDSDELRVAASWIRDRLADAPEASIAVVVPNLDLRKAEIDRVFAEILAPDVQPIDSGTQNLPYEFSLGIPLDRTAPVAAALLLLRWTADALPLTSISLLLVSPYFGGGGAAVAEFDVHELRRTRLLRPELTLKAFLDLVRGSRRRDRLASLVARVQTMQRIATEEQLTPVSGAVVGPRQTYAEWTDAFRKLLEAAGWTAATDGSSLDFQTHRRFESALDEVATLDFSGQKPTAADALEALVRVARATVFAPESHNAPVQILGPLELGGVPFDALWFLSADDLTWPAQAATHPLIPFSLARALGMPSTDPAHDAALARHLTMRIAHSASQCVFSYAYQSEEGERRPSAALAMLDLGSFAPPAESPVRQVRPLLSQADDTRLPSLPQRVLRGGATVLQLQAACGFRAFAELRLHSAELEARETGMDARDRGTLVHTIMESFWARVETQDALRKLPEQARHAELDRSIDDAIATASRIASSPWDDAYIKVQRLRLQALLRPWLAVELERPNFVVTGAEKSLRNLSIGPLHLDLRVDRVDATAGGALIIDYKTGAAAPRDWLSDRPDAPQLPLYAVTAGADQLGQELGGVAFANLRAGEDLCLNGFADSPAVLARTARMEAATLADQIEQWHTILTDLAVAFAAGDARVLPKSYPNTCKHCAQRILCRLDPTTLDDFDDADLEAAPTGWGANLG